MQIDYEGYTLRAFATGYLDWGFELRKDRKRLFYSPHFLSSESYGFHWDEDTDEPGEDWTDEDWQERLRDEADDLIECCTPYFERED